MRQLRFEVIRAGKRNTEVGVSYLKDGEWHEVQGSFDIPTGPMEIPTGGFALLYPDDWDRGE